jgi:hypothetical protein
MQRIIRNGVLIVVLAAAALIVLRAKDSGAGPVPPPPQQEGGVSELPEFRPSEELPADAAVAFPTDI